MVIARSDTNSANSIWVAGAIAILLVTAPAQAQESQAGDPPERGGESPPPLEAEFVASTIFQEATVIARLRSPSSLDAHYFGVEGNDIGVFGLSWSLAWRGLNVAPGLGWAFGRENRPGLVLTARWSCEHPRWVTEGLWVQSLQAFLPERAEEGDGESAAEETVRHASVLDGIHVSARLGRAEIGPLVEHIQYREEREWKGGARFAWLVAHGVRLVTQVLGPGAEVRGGMAWKP
jgi:hypothetical protein